MKNQWESIRAKIDDMSLRERTIVFLAAAAVVILLMRLALLDPLSAKQKMLSAQMAEQQAKMKELQSLAQTQDALKAKHEQDLLPVRNHLAQLKQQLKDQEDFLKSQDHLVEPDKMADLLRQVLDKDDKLQLVELKTLPVSPLIEQQQAEAQPPAMKASDGKSPDGQKQPAVKKQIFKHGVQITVRGSYLDILRYITALEKLPAQMFWGEASLTVDKYPDAVLTLTLYTLSLDKTWLTV